MLILLCLTIMMCAWLAYILARRESSTLPSALLLSSGRVVPQPFHTLLLQERGFRLADNTNGNGALLLLVSQTRVEVELAAALRRHPAVRWVFGGVAGLDELASKSRLAHALQRAGLQHHIPETFVLSRDDHVARLLAAPAGPDVYMFKSNLQRQQGIVLTHRPAEVMKRMAEDPALPYVVCQRVVQDPLVLSGRKCTIRVYVLLCVRAGRLTAHASRDGFLYYTPKDYEQHTVEAERVVATGYIDRVVYETRPLTLVDLRAHVGPGAHAALMRRMHSVLGDVVRLYRSHLLRANLGRCSLTAFTIMGADLQPTSDLHQVTLLELNKGCDLSAKDARDGQLKAALVDTAMALAGCVAATERSQALSPQLWTRLA
jgi:hypothetical protein